MVRRKKAKANASTSRSRRKAEVAVKKAQSEASASSPVMTGATMEDGNDGTELLNKEEDVGEVGGYQAIEAEVTAGEENANEQRLEQGSGVILTDSINSEEHIKEEVVNEENINEQCFVEGFENIAMKVVTCDSNGKKVGINKEMEVEPLNMDNEVDKWFVTPNESNEAKVLADEIVTSGCLGKGNATVAVGEDVEKITEENVEYEENSGEYANKDEDRIADDIAKEGEDKKEEYDEVEEDEEAENIRMDELHAEEDVVHNEVDDTHLEAEIQKSVFNENGGEEDVGKGNCRGISMEQHLEEKEDILEAGVNNLRNEVEETPIGVEVDGKTADGCGYEKDVAGKENCKGVIEDQQEEEVQKIKKGKIIKSRKRIRTSTIMARSAGKLVLKTHDEPKRSHKKKLEQGADEDMKEHKNGSGYEKDVAGKENCKGVTEEQQEEEVQKIEKEKIINSRKRIRTSTIMARSAGKLTLKTHDEPKCSHKKKLEHGADEDMKEHKNGEDDIPNMDNDKNNVAYGNKGKQKVGVHVDIGGQKVQVNTEKEVGESSKKKRKRSKQKSRWDPLVQGSLVKVASESEGKSGLSSNGLLKAEPKGMIFMCSSKTKQDCYRYMVLGLPAGKREIVEKIYKGMILFLYDVDKKLLNGIYKAAACGGYDIEPKAFNSKFPAQVRFEILEGCLPLEEEKFSEVIRDNYYTRSKFDCQLNSAQVENLCNLFRESIKGVKAERRRNRRALERASKVRDQAREKAKAKVKAARALFVAESHKVRPPPSRKGCREGRHHHERPLVHNKVASFPRTPVRLSQATASSYAYERTLKREEAYRGEPSIAHHEIYKQLQLLEPRDTYRRELLSDRRDTYSPDPYLDHSGTYRHERLLVPRDSLRVDHPPLQPRDSFRVEQSPLQFRDSYNQYPVLERRDYKLGPLAERRDYDMEPLAEHRDSYRLQSSLLDHQNFYRKDPVLEHQNRQPLDLEPRYSNIRLREDVHLSRRYHSAYSGGVYSSTTQPLWVSTVPTSRAVGLATVYPSSSEVEPRYYSHRPVYRL